TDRSGYCEDHRSYNDERRKAWFKRMDEQRQNSSRRGYGAEWRKLRNAKLRANPLCEICGAPASVVHHKDHNQYNDFGIIWKACADRATKNIMAGSGEKIMSGTSKSGRKRLPAGIKELKGTLQNCRENKLAPKPGKTTLEPPAYLNDIAAVDYRRKAELLDRLGVFKEGDDVALSAYAEAYSRWIDAVEHLRQNGQILTGKDGQPMRNPVLFNINNALDQMYKYLTEFGLTPVSRSRVKVDDKQKQNEWEMFSSNADPMQKKSIQ
ncbi:MAG: phage terminase small subunit P27 family, partial [Desulfovibrio sp.]|nr:phage terminase small subunit P27 family [Desulfovibrio sp.]